MTFLLSVLPFLIGASLIATVVVLLTGIGTMSRAGSFNQRYGNRLMRWRVGLQALTIALVGLYVLLLAL